ncbi:hypothetical protein L7750_18100 [Xenorhabdus bovienii]|uniref:hypothetical protein n=1 Tax=Xenorhabdus bovienii TaxID=40576 RepID=UPI001EE13B39|nr:hypothetical protein [Xenorhabdus bovienii]MCG3472221.1 hypothetical protein [Xenorhabdus bovienii]
MNNNEEQKDIINPLNNNVIQKVRILSLETSPESSGSNNVRVIYEDHFGKVNDNLLLAYPDKYIEGIGVYNTLLIALTSNIFVTLKTTGYIDKTGLGYISGVIIENPNKNQGK